MPQNKAPITELRCQFCHKPSAFADWRDNRNCPKCGRAFDLTGYPELRDDPQVLRFADIRAEEISNGTKLFADLTGFDREAVFCEACEDLTAAGERDYDRRIERTQ